MSKVYLVYGNTYFEGYGAYINTFGVFSTLEEAEKVKKQKEDDRSEVEFQIREIDVDEIIDKILGGYAE